MAVALFLFIDLLRVRCANMHNMFYIYALFGIGFSTYNIMWWKHVWSIHTNGVWSANSSLPKFTHGCIRLVWFCDSHSIVSCFEARASWLCSSTRLFSHWCESCRCLGRSGEIKWRTSARRKNYDIELCRHAGQCSVRKLLNSLIVYLVCADNHGSVCLRIHVHMCMCVCVWQRSSSYTIFSFLFLRFYWYVTIDSEVFPLRSALSCKSNWHWISRAVFFLFAMLQTATASIDCCCFQFHLWKGPPQQKNHNIRQGE